MRSAQTVTGFAVMLWGMACGLTEPDVITIHVRGHVLNRQDGSPVSARVQLEHEESDGDWVWTSYRTVVDASTTSNHAGRYDLEYRTEGCRSYTLAVEADGFIPFTRERIPCIDGVQTVTVRLDPGRCIPGLFGCTWIPLTGITLLAPATGASVPQNDSSIGCPAHPTRGYGFRIRFAWTRSTHAATAVYRLRVQQRAASNPLLNLVVSGTEYTTTHCHTFVADAYLADWVWTVQAVDRAGTAVQSSDEGHFQFAPCRLAEGEPCSAASR